MAPRPPVFGDAEPGVELMSLEGTARCGHVVVATHGEPEAFRVSGPDYCLDVTGNAFAAAEG